MFFAAKLNIACSTIYFKRITINHICSQNVKWVESWKRTLLIEIQYLKKNKKKTFSIQFLKMYASFSCSSWNRAGPTLEQ